VRIANFILIMHIRCSEDMSPQKGKSQAEKYRSILPMKSAARKSKDAEANTSFAALPLPDPRLPQPPFVATLSLYYKHLPQPKSTYPILKSKSDRKPDPTCVKQSYHTSACHKHPSCIFQRYIVRSNHDTRRRPESWVKMWLGERGPRRIGLP
jgi:hypothetical protein